MLKQRIITALILAVVFFGALFGLSTPHFALVALVWVMIAAYEWARLSGTEKTGAFGFCAIVLAVGMVSVFNQLAGVIGPTPLLLYAFCGAAVVFWLFVAPFWLNGQWSTRRQGLMRALGFVLILSLWTAMVALHARSPWLLLAVMVIVWLADTAAYFSGKKFGRRKLAPVISPNKSWEGVYGAIVCVGIYAVLVVLWSPLSTLSAGARVAIVVLALGLAAISVVGDLYESVMKRQAGVKDSGVVLPGHGGVLDRIDAQFPVLPIAALAALAFSRMT